MQNKLILNPSRQATLESCKLLYHRLYNLFLDLPGPPISSKSGQPFMGSLIHVTHAAFDTGSDYKKAIKAEIKKLHKTIHYNVKYAPMVDQLEREAIKIFEGGVVKDGNGKPHKFESYPTWRENMTGMSSRDDEKGEPIEVDVVDVEKRLWADVGPVILAPKLDCVLVAYNLFGRDEETWWVEEHKSTARDDSGWRWRWEMDGQTTCQIVAAEKHYGKPFEGVLVNQVVVTRQKPKLQTRLPPINKVVRYPARWVSKKPEVRAHYMTYLEDLAKSFDVKVHSGDWPATGMLNRHCDLCHHKPICSGRQSADTLQPTERDEIQLEFEKRHAKALPQVKERKTKTRRR